MDDAAAKMGAVDGGGAGARARGGAGGHRGGTGGGRARRVRRGHADPRRSSGDAAQVGAGDAMCKELMSELQELSQRVSNQREYKETGRACLLAGMSSHE
ncbi:hypothetical protein ACP70R_043069 [Stipagrostis hirtigluma subsp. patula]